MPSLKLKNLLAFVVGISIVGSAKASGDLQCVTVEIPAYVLAPDSNCRISTNNLVKKHLEVTFLYDLGAPAESTCFKLVNQYGGRHLRGRAFDPLPDPATDATRTADITLVGIAGLTTPGSNTVDSDIMNTGTLDAVTVVAIDQDGERKGKLLTQDSGVVHNNNNPPASFVAGRLRVVAGTKELKQVVGDLYEFGHGFNIKFPARASGILCGKDLADELLDDTHYEDVTESK